MHHSSGPESGQGSGHDSGAGSAPRRRKEKRRVWWVLMAVSVIVILVSGYNMGQRIGRYYKRVNHPLFAYVETASTDFVFADRRVHIEEVVDESDGKPAVRITYGQHELLLDVVIPPKHPLPTLFDRQREWFAMVFFADRSGMTLDQFEEGIANDTIRPRLGIVTRTPFGIEPIKEPRFDSLEREKNWATGEVHSDRWRYDFYEFKRDGSITHEVKRFPESGKSFLRRRVNAKLKNLPEPQRASDEIQEYTWEWGAAIKVTHRPPAITQERQALLDAGWTLPVAASGFLLLIVSFFFAIAPERVRR